ncbi:glycoside hydrolase [Aspergillus heteromorphus CBS 117.55]|uniref:chitinase n=1 Tax=Aspergillus heteromorphus CBS 117.55 TaxID=1448321 RepID=A0A317VM74_9EURO|nr:glycoside hydrolase [Aspergillus heteromorphus CBS 117.55]PWY73000.1 glycoside hydrolase [Aspergillus heteromorphus CBS 117.55]
MASGAVADSLNASAALQAYLSTHPISTRSAPASQSTTDLDSLKAAVLAGNFTPSRSWEFLRDPCPGSCTNLGTDSSAWPVYSSVSRLSRCNSTMLLDFALYTDVDQSSGHVSIRGCSADLVASLEGLTGNSSCPVPGNTTAVTSLMEISQDNTTVPVGNAADAVAALGELLAYETLIPNRCNETINFAYSGETAVGLYAGSSLHSQNILTTVLVTLMEYIDQNGAPGTLVVQLCDERSARYSLGIMISSSGDLSATQSAVQTWRSDSCVNTVSESNPWVNLTTNSSSLWARHMRARTSDDTCTTVQVVSGDSCATLATECGITADELTTYNPSSTLCSTLTVGEYVCCSEGTLPDNAPSPDADDNCYSYLVEKGDSCDALATTYTLTVAEIESYNNDTWGWMGCDDLLAGEYICLSSGWPPMPAVISNAVCGPQVNGTATVPHGTDLSTLNECPLNACCDIWGQCGITAEFCTPTNSTTGAPGTAANGTNGCISNCGTEIVLGDAPTELFKIGYFEGYDTDRVCMRTMISDIDTSAYTHIHMSFATLNADFSYNISSIESQMDDFILLDGVKRIMTVGGWSFSTDVGTYDIFREAVGSSDNRATLISNTIDFLDTYDLDGIDWDWEYPAEPDIPDIPADSTDDGTNFFLFLMELSLQMEIDVPNKTISTTAPSSYWYMKGIPIMAISEVVDYIVLMAYDLHGQWDYNNTYADPGCPDGSCLRSHVNLTETLSALSMITKAGVASNQVAVGVASYARSFQMVEAGCYGPDCFFTGPDSGAVPGPCTDTAGYISNVELAAIAEEMEVYTYIDDSANSNIMVWNETQWAGYMDDDIKATRFTLYEEYNFLGTADWAIDLIDTSGSSSEGSACEVYIDPSIWDEDEPSVTAIPGCSLIWPPQPLSTTTTITFPAWTTTITYTTVVTETTSASSGADVTALTSHVSYWFPTVITIDPIPTTAIPVWGVNLPNSSTTGTIYLTSSVEPSPFALVYTPTVGGTTVVSSATTTATQTSEVFIWGDYTYTEPGVTETLGGSTTVISGTTLPPVTTTLTPVVYPSTTATTHDTKLNTKTTHWKSGKPASPTATSGCAGCGTGCKLFCDSSCPTCPFGIETDGGGGGDNPDDDDSGCEVTATTKTFTSATTAACPVVTAGTDLYLNADVFDGCAPCAWHFIPLYNDDDDTYEDDWPMLYESTFAWPSIDLKRRGMDSDLPRETGAAITAPPDAMITPGPKIPGTPKAHGGLAKRENKRETITKVGACAIPDGTTVTVPEYTPGISWFNSELAGEIVGTQTSMPRWYHTTTAAGCAVQVTQAAIADLSTDFQYVATLDHACKFPGPRHLVLRC